ncbi:RING finger protein 39, partial [Bos mutus]
WLKTEAIPGKPQKVNAGGGERGRDAASSRGAPPSAHPKAVAVVAEGTAPGRWLPMEASELLGPGLVERLEQLATCPLCGGPFEDPVLLEEEQEGGRRKSGRGEMEGGCQKEGRREAGPNFPAASWGRSPRSGLDLAVLLVIVVLSPSQGPRQRRTRVEARAHTHVFFCPLQDMKMTWRRFDAPTPKASNSEDELPEDYPVVKNMLHRLTADLTLDPGTAHRRLLVSEDRRSVRLAPPGTPAPPDGPARFDQLPAVLGAQGFGAGRHCWEVETADAASRGDSSGEDEDDGESLYALGAAGESVRRKGRVGLCPAGAVWAVEGRGGRLWALTAPEPTPLGGARPPPRRIRVDLDWERGRVAFYDGRSLDLLFAFQTPGPLGERVFPLLCTRDARAQLRIVPAEG